MEQAFYLQQVFNVFSAVQALLGFGPPGLNNFKFRLPIAQDMGINTNNTADLSYPEVNPVRYFS
jgi:hypothetical protein